MKLLTWSGLALLALALLVEPAWADIRPPDYPYDGARNTGGMVATILAGVALTAALVAAGVWLARRGTSNGEQPSAVEAQQSEASSR